MSGPSQPPTCPPSPPACPGSGARASVRPPGPPGRIARHRGPQSLVWAKSPIPAGSAGNRMRRTAQDGRSRPGPTRTPLDSARRWMSGHRRPGATSSHGGRPAGRPGSREDPYPGSRSTARRECRDGRTVSGPSSRQRMGPGDSLGPAHRRAQSLRRGALPTPPPHPRLSARAGQARLSRWRAPADRVSSARGRCKASRLASGKRESTWQAGCDIACISSAP
jgi:hypothetical protein